MEWCHETEKLVERIHQVAMNSAQAHGTAALWYGQQSRCLEVPSLILSTMCGSASILLDTSGLRQYVSYGLIGVACIGFVNSIIKSLSMYLDYGRKSGLHCSTATSYATIGEQAWFILARPAEARPECGHAIENLQQSLSTLAESSPNVPQHVIRNWKSQHAEDESARPFWLNGHVHQLVSPQVEPDPASDHD